jgi:hypothetical protein
MPRPLTLKEEQLLCKIIDFMGKTGHAPSIREAQEIGGFSSSRTAAAYLERLEAAEYIKRGSGRRSLRVLADPREVRPARKRPQKKRTEEDNAPPKRPGRAPLADATDLDGWSKRRDAQDTLPQLVRRLIFATTDRSGTVTFAAGEGVQYAGLDGFTDFESRTSFVPSGPTVWELGTGTRVEDKAQSDYRSRTDDPLGLVPAKTTFIFVTTRRWPGKAAWVARRRAEKVWRDVRVYDADDLESWLELAPAVHAWISGLLGKGSDGAADLAGYATDWLDATNPPLTSEFVLAGRDHAATAVREWLVGAAPSIAIRAETRDEAVVFFASVLTLLPENERQRHELRAVVVRTETAWQQLALSRDPLLLIPIFTPSSTAAAERNGHRVVLPLSRADVTTRTPIEVGHVDRPSAEAVLTKMNIPEQDARTLAHLARRSMMAFRRVRGRTPELLQPTWASPGNGRLIALVMLVSTWDETKDADRAAVSGITGMPYDQLERELVRWSTEADAPIRHIGTKWLIASKEDAWPLVTRYLTRDDLQRFHNVAVEILGAPDPRFDLEREKQWMANILGHERPHSYTLIKGIANTIALMGARGEITRATTGESAQSIASAIVWRVLDKANDDHRIWASLNGVLPLLAEAAPDRFLEGVEKGLRGPTPILRHMFTDAPGTSSMTNSSPHPSLLWALERLGWAPEYLARAVSALARLALLDQPRGTLGNRPDGSLRQLFLFWHPQTHATVAQRLDVIDRLRKSSPTIAWRLMISLVPTGHDTSMNHGPAEWREWGVERPVVTRGDYAQGVRGVIARLLEDVGEDAARWKDLIGHFEKIPRDDSLKAIERLEGIANDRFDAAARETIRTAVREAISFHRSHPDANWELTSDDLERMAAIHDRLAPQDLAERHRWLFAQRPALLEGRDVDWDAHAALLAQHRMDAVRAIHAEGGMTGVLAFAHNVEYPNEVGVALAASGQVETDITAIVQEHLTSTDSAMDRFARGLALETEHQRGRTWITDLIQGEAQNWTPEQRAVLLTFLPDKDDATWEVVDAADAATQAAYWPRMYPWTVPPNRFEITIRSLMQHGRPYAAADVLAGAAHSRSKPTPAPELIADALEAVLASAPTDRDPIPQNFGYDLGVLVESLAKEPGAVPLSRIAGIEWQLLPLLSNHDLEPRILHGELARDPSFFTELVTIVFRAEDQEEEAHKLTEDESVRARAAYELLESMHTLPGTRPDGSVDASALATWVKTARNLLADARRPTVGDSRIGNVLGASPIGEDGLWPHEAVRDILESEESPEIERGISISVYNSRGVVSKDLREGGAQERELVTRYEGYSAAMADRWPRTAAMLRQIAASYKHDAERSDTDVELRDHLE